jgi:23S rRNA maturation mini-RNase III
MVPFTEKCKWRKRMFKSTFHKDALKKTASEFTKLPLRTTIINQLLQFLDGPENNYLEIGVRMQEENFNKIVTTNKYSVDSGVEFIENPIDFKATTDEFFKQLSDGKILDKKLAHVAFELISQ